MKMPPLLLFLFSAPLSVRAEPLHERVVVVAAQGEAEEATIRGHRTTVKADQETGPEPPGERSYEEVFEPSLFPYKRMSTFDTALPNERLAVRAYVENELHVFVEVYVSTFGWRRIDLGGAPVNLARRAGDRREQQRLREDRRAADSRLIPTLRVQLGSLTGYRGESVELSGTIAEPRCGELPVEIFLEGPSGAIRLGATTAHQGRFRLAAGVPREVAIGYHKVIAKTVGDDHCAAASSSDAPLTPSL